ncbi:hypothetical protein ACS5PN_07700 [Roseateles sp. NT4]|uniref:hypothetical protein n=1 Tax=Roseateles sp. NT4 TaxID=3453715 RepID=UPI003EE889DF
MQTAPLKPEALAQVHVPTTPPGTDAGDLDSIYDNLVHGVGHEYVTEANVEALMQRAAADHHPVLAEELREWRSNSDGKDATPATS